MASGGGQYDAKAKAADLDALRNGRAEEGSVVQEDAMDVCSGGLLFSAM